MQNLDTKAEAVETKGFDDIHNKLPLEEALAELTLLGGKAEASSIGSLPKGKKITPGLKDQP